MLFGRCKDPVMTFGSIGKTVVASNTCMIVCHPNLVAWTLTNFRPICVWPLQMPACIDFAALLWAVKLDRSSSNFQKSSMKSLLAVPLCFKQHWAIYTSKIVLKWPWNWAWNLIWESAFKYFRFRFALNKQKMSWNEPEIEPEMWSEKHDQVFQVII